MSASFKTMQFQFITSDVSDFTARKRSLRRLCFYRCVSVHVGGVIPACIAGGIPACFAAGLQMGLCGIPAYLAGFQAHTQGGSWRGSGWGGGGSPGPHPRGAVEGDQARVGSPGPHSRGKLRGIWPGGACSEVACSRGVPAPRGEGMPAPGGVWRPPPVTATAAGGTHPTGMHSCSSFFLLLGLPSSVKMVPNHYLSNFPANHMGWGGLRLR